MAVTATKTKVELRSEIAGRLGLLARGFSLDANDAQDIDEAIDSGFRELNRLDKINFDMSDDAAIEAYLFMALAEYITPYLIDKFPQAPEKELRTMALGGRVAEAKIVKFIADTYTSKSNPSVYF